MDGELLRAVVDIHMVELNIRIVLVMDLDDGASPEAGGRKDIGFVDTCQVTMTLAAASMAKRVMRSTSGTE